MNVILFVIFLLMLLSLVLFPKHAMVCALTGLIILVALKLFGGNFSMIHHLLGDAEHEGEWKILLNLFGLLTGFEILSTHFTGTGIPARLPALLPDDWKGGFVLLVFIFILSAFLDNIASAMIGGAVAKVVFNDKVHLGYVAAIVAASNAGGAGSVLGDTTTTMMWISGIPAKTLFTGYGGSAVAFLIVALFASRQQDQYNRIIKDASIHSPVSPAKLFMVVLMLVATALANFLIDMPAAGLWLIILLSSVWIKVPWKQFRESLGGAIFLLCLVMSASLLPVNELPAPTATTTMMLGFGSAIFDNIPLTRIAILQGGYDWAMLAYCIGFGGSIIWFGSSAGVAVSNLFPESRSAIRWMKAGWYIAVAYLAGFAVQYALVGWNP